MSDDLIKRSDAIGACAYETIECYEARKTIRNLPSADRPQGEWIPFSEMLPDEEYALVSGKGLEYPYILARTEDLEYLFKRNKHFANLAWTHLPKPWKGADDE